MSNAPFIGARQSTPVEMIYCFNPDIIVVSNGMEKLFNHPREFIDFVLSIYLLIDNYRL